MFAMKPAAWEFIVKAIEALDSELGIEYIKTPVPLLWKVIRESYQCAAPAIKLMTERLLRVNS